MRTDILEEHEIHTGADLSQAFSDLTICDLSQGIAGPHATMLFAQFGARVVKVEPPGGDWGRQLGQQVGDHCAHSWQYNLGKESVCLNLKEADGREVLRQLISESDIFVESFRPGVAARLGFGYDEVCEIQPRTIYASLSGFGQSGPNSERGTVDALIQGFSGMMVMNKTPDGIPHKQSMVAVDVVSGLYLFSALATALANRHRTGVGCYLDVSLMQSAAAFQAAKVTEFQISGGKPRAFYGPVGYLPTRAGGIVVSCRLPHHFGLLCKVLGCDDLVTDPRFVKPEDRVTNASVLMEVLASITVALEATPLLDALLEAGVLAEHVHTYGSWLEDPHVNAVSAFEWVDGGDFGKLPLVRFPGAKMVESARTHAPKVGEHTRQVLEGLSVPTAKIDKLLGSSH